MSLVQIEKGYSLWKMKDEPTSVFLAKKTEGGGWYYIILTDGTRLRHTAAVVERLAEEVRCDTTEKPISVETEKP